MNIEIRIAQKDEEPVLKHLLELYLYDFTEFLDLDVQDDGTFGYKYLPHYWTESGRYPFIVSVDGKWAGFVLVRFIQEEGKEAYYSVAEFFVMKKYRGLGLGKKMAVHVFDQFPGKWEVTQFEKNVPAQRFWRKVIAEYTGGKFEERTKENGVVMQEFKSSKDRTS